MTEMRLRSDKLQWIETGGEVVALDEAALTYLSANESASLLWQELARGTTRERLISRLVSSFGITTEAAAADVDRFLADLEARDLLER